MNHTSVSQEKLPEQRKILLSFYARDVIIKKLRIEFKVKKERNTLLQRSMGTRGFKKQKNEKTQEKWLTKWPFENYVFTGDNWEDFIQEIFLKIQNFSIKFIEYKITSLENIDIEEQENEEISWENLTTWKILISQYLDILESLVCSWIWFIEDENYEKLVFKDFIEKYGEMEKLNNHPIFSFLQFNGDFHIRFIEYITRVFLYEQKAKGITREKEIQKLTQQITRLQREKTKTSESLREAVRSKVHSNIQTIPNQQEDFIKVTKEKERLEEILKQIWYDPTLVQSPEKWLKNKEEEILKQQSLEWERIAMEESHKTENLSHIVSRQESYIAFLENQFNGVHISLEKQYQDERWNSGKMSIDEILFYLSENPNITQNVAPYIIDIIENINSQIGGISLSSTGNGNTGIGSGHIANIVIVPLLNFIKKHIKNTHYEYLAYSWKKIVELYIQEKGWCVTEWDCSTFSLLYNHLPEEPGNIANIDALNIGMRGMETKIHADLKKFCEIISKLFSERMNVFQRQIMTKNEKIGQ